MTETKTIADAANWLAAVKYAQRFNDPQTAATELNKLGYRDGYGNYLSAELVSKWPPAPKEVHRVVVR